MSYVRFHLTNCNRREVRRIFEKDKLKQQERALANNCKKKKQLLAPSCLSFLPSCLSAQNKPSAPVWIWVRIKTLYFHYNCFGYKRLKILRNKSHQLCESDRPARCSAWQQNNPTSNLSPLERNGSVGTANLLRDGRSGIRIPVGLHFSAPVQTVSVAHPASCAMGTGPVARGKRSRVVALTTHPNPAPRLKKE